MKGGGEGNLDPRAWVAWAVAASMPPLLGRNPWPLVAVLISIAGVRAAWADRMGGGRSWGLFLRIAIVFAAISVLFNILTVRAGDRVITKLPDEIPLIGGEITLNAAVFGLLSGFALVLLVMTGSTVAAVLDWPAVVRLLPNSLTGIAVAGSIAFAFVPQTAIAFREIREAQSARGHRVRGARDLLPILVPMIGSGLERAITLAEALESRAFGAPASPEVRSPAWARYAVAFGLTAGAMAAYLVASGRSLAAGCAGAGATGAFLLVVKTGKRVAIARTRYRALVWTGRDSVVVAGATVAALATLVTVERIPAALRYEPYPHLSSPHVSLPLLLALLALLAPAVVAPAPVIDS